MLTALVALPLCGLTSCAGNGPESPHSENEGLRYEITAYFPSPAAGLEAGDEVRIGGVTVGTVAAVAEGQAGSPLEATLRIEPKFAPISDKARAILRYKTLLNETYVELAGPPPIAGDVPAGGEVSDAEIRRSLDPKTRRQFKRWQQDRQDRAHNDD